MPELAWDQVGERVYETGLDKGVLYLPDGSAVPWNGLTSIIEQFDKNSSPVYYDGMKINDLVTLGDFEASMKAVTYPDEFLELEGLAEQTQGVFYADQMPKSFGLCYRTQVGNDLEGDAVGHKIHILYNVTAIPHEKTYATVTADPSLVEFEWDITAVPEEIPGLRPTSHVILDTRTIDPWLLEDLLVVLYGNMGNYAALIPMDELVTKITDWFRVKIVDNGDGTWTATSEREGFIDILGSYFEITGINAVYLDDVTFEISDTLNLSDVPQLAIRNNGNGTWTASTDQGGLIVDMGDETVEIRNANIEVLNSTTYRISDTTDED